MSSHESYIDKRLDHKVRARLSKGLEEKVCEKKYYRPSGVGEVEQIKVSDESRDNSPVGDETLLRTYVRSYILYNYCYSVFAVGATDSSGLSRSGLTPSVLQNWKEDLFVFFLHFELFKLLFLHLIFKTCWEPLLTAAG